MSIIKIFQLIVALLLILIVVPQTPTENIILRKFSETGFFTSYSESKKFVNILTWGLIFLFFLFTFLLNLKY
jgi:protein translocase SecG subunit